MSRIEPQMTMAQVLGIYPGAQRAMFRKYHIGGCSSCGFSPDETLAEVCVRNENLAPAEVIAYLDESRQEDEKMMISPRELAKALRQEQSDVRILDVRTQEEFEAVHLPKSVHFTQPMMQEVMATWPKESLLVILDHQGQRSLDAAAYFTGHGFTNVKSLRGGIDAWSVEVDPATPRYTLEVSAEA